MGRSTSIKLAEDLPDRVRAIAQDEQRSANWIMNEAIRQYVEQKERRKEVLAEMRAAHEDYQRTGLHLTQEEVEEWMARRARGERVPVPKLHD